MTDAGALAMSAELADLIATLERQAILGELGYAFLPDPRGRVVVERWGHARGFWGHDGVAYAWTPAGNGEATHFCPDVDGAVRHTLVVLSVT